MLNSEKVHQFSVGEFQKFLVQLYHDRPQKKPYLIKWTKDLADFVLEHRNHKGGRRINVKALERLTRDMEAGDFKLTHQGLAFQEDGLLADGQLRLTAISQVGQPVVLVTFFNLSLLEAAVIDRVDGTIPVSPNPALGQMFHPFFTRMGVKVSRLTTSQRMSYFEYFRKSLEWAVHNIKAKYYGRASVRVAFARAYHAGLDPDKLLEFWRIFSLHGPEGGVFEVGAPKLISSLRDNLVGITPNILGFREPPHLLKTLQCKCVEVLLYHYCNGTLPTLKSLKVEVGRLEAGKLFTVEKPTEEDLTRQKEVFARAAEKVAFCWDGLEELKPD